MTIGSNRPALCVLGPITLTGAGGEVGLGGDKPRRLLAALAVHANEVVSSGRLAEVVWGDAPPRSARKNLHTYVWSLRKALIAAGAAGISIGAPPPGYVLRADADGLDWLRFQRLSAAGAGLVCTDAAGAAELLGAALSLWRGEVAADVTGDLAPLQARLAAMEEARMTALVHRLATDLDLGRHLELAAELGELTRSYPRHERLRAFQMIALYRGGRQTEALAAFRDLRGRLARELGIDPAPECGRLHELMLRADPDVGEAPVRVLTGAPRGRR